jgi:putative tricarboxylic transport membrane protein
MSTKGAFTIRWGDIATNVVILLFSAFVMWEGLKLGAGWGDAGPKPGFFPFYLTLFMMLGAGGALVQAWRSTDAQPFFEDRQEIIDLLKVGVPAALAIAFVPVLGLYVTTALYVGLFGYWYGRFTWYWSLLAGIAVPLVLYVMLRIGFNILMPTSIWNDTLLPF